MKRFIIVSFAFLAWAFYELSGGADFQPRVAPTLPDTQSTAAMATPPAKVRPVEPTTLIASPVIVPRTSQPTRPASLPVEVTEPAEPDIATVAQLDQIRASLSQGVPLFPESAAIAQPLTLASLEQGAAGLRAAPPSQADTAAAEPVALSPPKADIREVTGTRVNMRDGPGTIYPVISRLTIGHEVEILGESGTGWLRLRILPEQQIGWISASLVSKAGG